MSGWTHVEVAGRRYAFSDAVLGRAAAYLVAGAPIGECGRLCAAYHSHGRGCRHLAWQLLRQVTREPGA